jgi:hypothetical protein
MLIRFFFLKKYQKSIINNHKHTKYLNKIIKTTTTRLHLSLGFGWELRAPPNQPTNQQGTCPLHRRSNTDLLAVAGRSAAAAPWTQKRCGGHSSPPRPPRTYRDPPLTTPSSSAASASTPPSTAASSSPSWSPPATP